MAFEIVDPNQFIPGGMFRQDPFLEAVQAFDWSRYEGKKVLVRGCGDVIVPPWAYMVLTGRLSQYAASIRYGNEHDNVVVYRRPRPETA